MGIQAGSLRATLFGIRNINVTTAKAANVALSSAGKALKTAARANLSASDFTMGQLAALDHPYARRHGSISVNTSGGSGFLSAPQNRVHNRTGEMRSALHGVRTKHGLSGVFKLWVDTNAAPHARYVIQGTNVMLPRDVLWDTAHAPKTRQAMMKAMVLALGKRLRSQASVRFGSGAPPGSRSGLGGAL